VTAREAMTPAPRTVTPRIVERAGAARRLLLTRSDLLRAPGLDEPEAVA
jgi:hypothetical protein